MRFGSDDQIRLLEVLPGMRQDAVINCRLQHYDLTSTPRYEAISYCWGDATDLTPIHVNDHKFNITRNLHDALFHLRLKDKSRLIWVDAICINQQDRAERASQVSIMNQIYQNSLRTLIWLGPGNEKTPHAFKQLHELASQAEAEASGTSDPTLRFGEHLNRNDSTIELLIEFPWWNRVWVVQELVLAPAALLVCGDQTMQWDRFSFTYDAALKHGLWNQILFGFIYDASFVPFNSIYNLYVWHTTGDLRAIGPADQLLHLLVALRGRKATDARDKVFSALGIMNDLGGTVGIVPDYDTPVEGIYKTTASCILQASCNLDILGVCSTRHLNESTFDLPSWVPDWSTTGVVAEPLFVTQQTSKFTASGDTKSSPRFPDSSTLLLSGHLFDTVVEVGDLSRNEDGAAWDNLDSDDDEPAKEGDLDPTVDPNRASNPNPTFTKPSDDADSIKHDAPDSRTATDSTAAQNSNSGSAKDSTATKDNPQEASASEDFADAFRELKSAARMLGKIYTNFADFTLHLAVYLSWERLAHVHTKKCPAPFTGESPVDAFMRTLCADQIVTDAHQLASVRSEFRIWMRSLSALRTMKMFKIDTFPRIFRPLGFLAYMRASWDAYPTFTTRMSATRVRRLGRTGLGCLCLLPNEARTGDQVWLARGGKVPLVLRPRDDDAWELVGEAYVHGIMYGEGFRGGDCIDICIK
jgi:hypothetical protein